jgi:hypothetical protein
MAMAGHPSLPTPVSEWMNRPLTSDEIYNAILKGGGKKAPGRDGINNDFYKANFDNLKDALMDLFNQMLRERKMTDQQKRGVIVCIPKHGQPLLPEDYWPITLLNTDYKILARIVENRIKPKLGEILHASQYCGVPGKTIFNAVAAVRDAVAYAETMHKPLCALYLDFKEAFNRISHKYLFPG